MTHPYSRINLIITTRCERACPDCCCGHGPDGVDYMPGAEIKHLKPVDTLIVTGGEPGLHPILDSVIEVAKRLCSPQRVDLATADVATAVWARGLVDRVLLSPTKSHHLPPNDGTRTRSCGRDAGHAAAYLDGRMYGCCVAPGLEGAPSVPLEPGWREALTACPPPPCHLCVFAKE